MKRLYSLRRHEWPEVRSEDHNVEVDVHVVVVVLHALLEVVREILGQRHIYNEELSAHRREKDHECHTTEHALLGDFTSMDSAEKPSSSSTY